MNSSGGNDLPANFQATFKRVQPKEPPHRHHSRTTPHERLPSQRLHVNLKAETTTIIADSSAQDRPTAIGNKHPFARPSQQMDTRPVEVVAPPPPPVQPQKPNRVKPTATATVTHQVDPKQVRKPVKVLDYVDRMPGDYRVVNGQNSTQKAVVVVDRRPREVVQSHVEPLVQYPNGHRT